MRKEVYSPIGGGFDDMLRQARMTADRYMRQAIEDIDAELGKGFAVKHPELIAAYMQLRLTSAPP
jgi:hypothetical protein